MPELSLDELPAKLRAIRSGIRDEYLVQSKRPWIVGFSGGKDSTLVLQLTIEAMLELQPDQRTRPVHVVSNDTLVESPIYQNFVNSTLDRIRRGTAALHLPVVVTQTVPRPSETFWANLIGRGYPAPTRNFRWCTDRMKIQPTTQAIKSVVDEGGEAVLLLGVRRSESSARAISAARYDKVTVGRLNPHNDIRNCHVFRPILELTTKEVWATLMQARPPWGGTHRELVTLYRNADDGECPFVTDSADAPSCGTGNSRFGCWTCTVVEKDKSLRNLIDNGNEELEPLADFRDWLRIFSVDLGNRQMRRRNGSPGIGPLKIEARKEILRRLLDMQDSIDTPLITEAEVLFCAQQWLDDERNMVLQDANHIVELINQGASK